MQFDIGAVSLIGSRDHNQDVFWIDRELFGKPGQCGIAVLDGHGQHGDMVATAVRDQFARLITRHQQALLTDPPQCLYDIFRELQRWLETNPVENMDVDLSGTTLTAAFVLHVADPEQAADSEPAPLLVIAHVGDSSALLASVKHTPKPVWKLNTLTEHHAWDNAEERTRATAQARIDRMPPDSDEQIEDEEELGPLRIYKGSLPYPGLAMSRSIGDLVAHQLGVTWEPSVAIRRLSPDDKFLVMATDGLWDVYTMKSVLKMARRCATAEGMCDLLKSKIENVAALDNTTILALRFVHPGSDLHDDSDNSGSA